MPDEYPGRVGVLIIDSAGKLTWATNSEARPRDGVIAGEAAMLLANAARCRWRDEESDGVKADTCVRGGGEAKAEVGSRDTRGTEGGAAAGAAAARGGAGLEAA
jgi:hypothetical protein